VELERRGLIRTESAPGQRGRPTTLTYAVPVVIPFNPLPTDTDVSTNQPNQLPVDTGNKKTEETDYIPARESEPEPPYSFGCTEQTEQTEKTEQTELTDDINRNADPVVVNHPSSKSSAPVAEATL
jgi:hypothetical protein